MVNEQAKYKGGHKDIPKKSKHLSLWGEEKNRKGDFSKVAKNKKNGVPRRKGKKNALDSGEKRKRATFQEKKKYPEKKKPSERESSKKKSPQLSRISEKKRNMRSGSVECREKTDVCNEKRRGGF